MENGKWDKQREGNSQFSILPVKLRNGASNSQFFSGYTLIEMLVVVTVIGILVGGGLVALVTFREKQHLRRAGTQLYGDVRLAQARASANERPEECNPGTLEGYGVQVTDGSGSYDIVGLCAGEVVELAGMEKSLPAGATTVTSSQCDSLVSFYILAKGAAEGMVCLSYGSRYYQVAVSLGGEVHDVGFVDEAAVLP